MGLFGGKGGSRPPDPMQAARTQMDLNRDVMRQNAMYSQINQNTPFGSTYWTGEIGSPDRTQHTQFNPMVQSIFGGLFRNMGSALGMPESNNLANVLAQASQPQMLPASSGGRRPGGRGPIITRSPEGMMFDALDKMYGPGARDEYMHFGLEAARQLKNSGAFDFHPISGNYYHGRRRGEYQNPIPYFRVTRDADGKRIYELSEPMENYAAGGWMRSLLKDGNYRIMGQGKNSEKRVTSSSRKNNRKRGSAGGTDYTFAHGSHDPIDRRGQRNPNAINLGSRGSGLVRALTSADNSIRAALNQPSRTAAQIKWDGPSRRSSSSSRSRSRGGGKGGSR